MKSITSRENSMCKVPKTQQNLALEELKEGQCGWSCIVMAGHYKEFSFHSKCNGESLKDFQPWVDTI